MATAKVSIIMPVYNTEEFIEETLQTIINQTLGEIEIITINDGSTDGSLSILERMALSDDRIKIISQANQGQSTARNLGVGLATGKYIYFMDSDDLLDHRTMQLCYEKCERNSLDFLIFDADTFGESGTFSSDFYRRTDEVEDKIYSGPEMMTHLLDIGKYRISPCLNFTRKGLLTENQITFPIIRRSEDELHTTQMYLCAKRVGVIKEAFFKRRVRLNSLMTRRFSIEDLKNYLFICDSLVEFARSKNDPTTTALINRYTSRMVDAAVRWQARTMPLGERLKTFGIVTCKYSKYVTIRTLVLLLLKQR